MAAMSIGGAVAGPTHAHLHRHAHEKKDAIDWATVVDWKNSGIDWTSAYEAGQASKTAVAAQSQATSVAAPVEAATTTAGSAPAATSKAAATTPASSSNSIISDLEGLFDDLVGASNTRSAFGAIVAAVGADGDNQRGNYGSPYGSNIIKVDSTANYAYTAEFHNTQSKPITVNIWNKVGPDMQVLSGSALAPKNTTLTFVLPAGKSQIVAFDEDTQAAFSEAVSSTTASGAYQTTWGELEFRKTGSGYDVSAINNPNNDYAMTITSAEAPACTSDRTQNFWLTASEPVGGSDGSCYIAQSSATLKVVMGGTV